MAGQGAVSVRGHWRGWWRGQGAVAKAEAGAGTLAGAVACAGPTWSRDRVQKGPTPAHLFNDEVVIIL